MRSNGLTWTYASFSIVFSLRSLYLLNVLSTMCWGFSSITWKYVSNLLLTPFLSPIRIKRLEIFCSSVHFGHSNFQFVIYTGIFLWFSKFSHCPSYFLVSSLDLVTQMRINYNFNNYFTTNWFVDMRSNPNNWIFTEFLCRINRGINRWIRKMKNIFVV